MKMKKQERDDLIIDLREKQKASYSKIASILGITIECARRHYLNAIERRSKSVRYQEAISLSRSVKIRPLVTYRDYVLGRYK
jgi:predicted ArsR family transcriptional regulator